MKRLMTMLAAVGMAFGLFADEPQQLNNETFESQTPGTAFDFSLTDAFWSPTEGWDDGTLTIGSMTIADLDQNVLNLNTGTKGLDFLFAESGTYTIPDAEGYTGVYFDGQIKFDQPADQAPTVEQIGSDGKLAFFVLDNTEDCDGTQAQASTNLWAVGGYWEAGDGTPVLAKRAFKLLGDRTIDEEWLDELHRVTIKGYKDATNGDQNPGFLVYIDEQPCQVSGFAPIGDDGKIDMANYQNASAGLYLGSVTAVGGAASRYNKRQLLLGLQAGGTAADLTAVEFKGKGTVRSAELTEVMPFDAFIDSQTLTITMGEGIESATYQVGLTSPVPMDPGANTIPFERGQTIYINATYAEGYGFNRAKWEGAAFAQATFEQGTGTTTATLAEMQDSCAGEFAGFKAVANATINGVSASYDSFAAVVAALDEAARSGSVTASIALVGDGSTPIVISDDEMYFNLTISEGMEVELDLAGQKLIGGDDGNWQLATILSYGGNLEITDTVGGGEILAPVYEDEMGTPYAVSAQGGMIHIAPEAEKSFKVGLVDLENGGTTDYLTISGAQFVGNGSEFDGTPVFYLNDSIEKDEESGEPLYQATWDGELWTVEEYVPTAYVAEIVGKKQFETLDEAIAEAEDNDTIKLLADIETTAQQQWTITKDIVIDFDEFTITKTVANDWVFTIADGADVTFTSAKGGGIVHYPAVLNQVNPASMIQILGKLTVTGGAYESDYTIFKVDEGKGAMGELVVSGGTFTIAPCEETTYTGKTYAVMNWSKATLNGGIFTGNIVTLSCDGNETVKAGATIVGSIIGNPVYKLQIEGTTYVNVPKIKGDDIDVDDVELVAENVADDLKLIKDEDGYVTVKAIDYARLTLTSDKGVETLTATNAAGEVFSDGAEFDKDDATELFACYELKENFELDAAQSVLAVTMDDDAEIIVKTKPQGGWDPDVDPTVPASAKGITGELAKASFKDLSVWAQTYGIDFEALKATPDAYANAFLLNCAMEDVANEAAAFKVTAFTQDTEGNWVVTAQDKNLSGEKYNGVTVIQSSASIEEPDWADGQTGPFFRAQLRVYSVAD